MRKYTERILLSPHQEDGVQAMAIEGTRMKLMKNVMRDRGLMEEDLISFRVYFEEDYQTLLEGDSRLPLAYSPGTIVYTVVGHVGDA